MIGKKSQAGLVSISLTLVTSIGLLVAVAVGSVFWILWSIAQDNTDKLVRQSVNLIAEKIIQDLDSQLAPAVHQLDFVARNLENDTVDLENKTELQTALLSSMAAVPQVFSISFINTNLQTTAARRIRDGQVVIQLLDRSKVANVVKEFNKSRTVKHAFWGDVGYFDGNVLVNRRKVINRAGVFVGILVVTVSIAQVSELIEKFGKSVNGNGFILYGEDKVLAHSSLITGYASQTTKTPLVGLDQIKDPVLNALGGVLGKPNDAPVAFAGGFERRPVDVGTEKFFTFIRWIETYGRPKWGVGVWLAGKDVDLAKRQLLNAGYIALGAVFLALLAAILVGRSIARPIQKITAISVKIGDFNLDDIEDLPPSLISELNDQANGFNKMLSGLRSFETYVPRTLVRKLIGKDKLDVTVSQDKELTVMFTDIAGFTAMSEGRPAQETAALVNEHFAILGKCVEDEGGTIDKYIGDALMAFWGAPDDQSDTAARACRAAMAIQAALREDNERRVQAGKQPIRIRIGIHTGPVLVGNIGTPGRVNYTIIGDTVNTCQRLEVLGNQFNEDEDAIILISDATRQQLPKKIKTKPVGTFEVKGKSKKIDVHKLTGS